MTNIETMKTYIRENNLTHMVRELVEVLGMTSASAIEDVYDAHVLSKEDYVAKYFG